MSGVLQRCLCGFFINIWVFEEPEPYLRLKNGHNGGIQLGLCNTFILQTSFQVGRVCSAAYGHLHIDPSRKCPECCLGRRGGVSVSSEVLDRVRVSHNEAL